ncbi:MAG: ribose 5-phosphate isomerase B [Alphaproteobacteria bacterium]|nr:ribose 5-phosphate isomerase B [Alphaproteobacteria bacterium]
MIQKLILAFSADHAGYTMKQHLIEYAQELGHVILDFGVQGLEPVDYPDLVPPVVESIVKGQAHFGIMVCGSGIGMDIAANRHAGIRAALCHCSLIATRARQHNNANVLCLGAQFIGNLVARECLLKFTTTNFEGGRHQRRIDKLQ